MHDWALASVVAREVGVGNQHVLYILGLYRICANNINCTTFAVPELEVSKRPK